MAFALDPSVSPRVALRRAARVECRRVLARLKHDAIQDIHDARKSLKRLRAWLRLLRPQLKGRYAVLNTLLRDSGRALASSRDADAAHATLLSLRRGRLLTSEHYALLIESLSTTPAAADARLQGRDDARRLMRAAQVYLKALSLPAIDDAALRQALGRSHQRCRRYWQRAKRRRDAETLHEWRKHVKRLAIQTQLLSTKLGDTGIDVDRLKTLAELLGRHHDHHQLGLRLETLAPSGQALLQLRLGDALRQRMQRLEQESLSLGARLFSRRPASTSEAC